MFLSSRVPEAGFKEAENWRRESDNLFKNHEKVIPMRKESRKSPGFCTNCTRVVGGSHVRQVRF